MYIKEKVVSLSRNRSFYGKSDIILGKIENDENYSPKAIKIRSNKISIFISTPIFRLLFCLYFFGHQTIRCDKISFTLRL